MVHKHSLDYKIQSHAIQFVTLRQGDRQFREGKSPTRAMM